jgi:hypothetical protein
MRGVPDEHRLRLLALARNLKLDLPKKVDPKGEMQKIGIK